MKSLAVVIAVLLVASSCSREDIYPYNHATGTIKVDGTDYQSALIIHFQSDGIHVVGGFISDANLPAITIGGPDNSQNAPLQIMPSRSLIVHKGERHKIQEDGYIIWFLNGKTYQQTLNGFPLEKDIHAPISAGVPNKTDTD